MSTARAQLKTTHRPVAWLAAVALVLAVAAAVTASTATQVGAQADPPVDEPEPCPPDNPNCGDPSFPPPPVDPVPDPDDPGGPGGPVDPVDPTDPDPDDGLGIPPVLPGLGNPLWFLPPEPDFEFAYDQQNYDLWLSRCGDQIQDAVEETTDGGFSFGGPSPEELPTIFWELYGDAERSCPDEARASNTLLDEAIGGDVIGRAGIPTGNYDIGYDEGAWNHWSRKLWGNLTAGLFSFNLWLTGSTINILDWAFSFDLASRLAAPANTIASGYYLSLNGSSVSAYDLALFITVFYFAIQLMMGRTTAAVGELAATYLIYAAFVAFVILVPGGFGKLITDTTDASGTMAASIAAVTLEGQANTFECPPVNDDLGTVVCPFGKGLHAAFVERPYDLINWGTNLGSGGDGGNGLQGCAAARDQILLTGPHGAADDPRFIMGIAGCEQLADFNHDPTPERAGMALMVVITSVLVNILAALTALTLIAAQLLLVGLIVVMPFAIVAGLMPGSGRSLLWKWVAAVAKVLFVVIAVAVFLSLYLVSVNLMLDATAEEPWMIQGGSLILLTMTMFVVRSRLLKASKRAAAQTGDRLNQARIGGSHGGGFFTAAGAGFAAAGGSGFGRGRGRNRYLPSYEVRAAYRDARQLPVNFQEWRANTRDRWAMRRGAIEGRPPPRGFTATRRRRSGMRIGRQERARRLRENSGSGRRNTGARRRVERTMAGAGRGGGTPPPPSSGPRSGSGGPARTGGPRRQSGPASPPRRRNSSTPPGGDTSPRRRSPSGPTPPAPRRRNSSRPPGGDTRPRRRPPRPPQGG